MFWRCANIHFWTLHRALNIQSQSRCCYFHRCQFGGHVECFEWPPQNTNVPISQILETRWHKVMILKAKHTFTRVRNPMVLIGRSNRLCHILVAILNSEVQIIGKRVLNSPLLFASSEYDFSSQIYIFRASGSNVRICFSKSVCLFRHPPDTQYNPNVT